MHYQINAVPDKRVREKLLQLGDCWIWQGSMNNNGYGHFVRGVADRKPGQSRQKKSYVHRYLYTIFKGPLKPNEEVHHTCYNRPCGYPGHLIAVTHAINVAFNKQLK